MKPFACLLALSLQAGPLWSQVVRLPMVGAPVGTLGAAAGASLAAGNTRIGSGIGNSPLSAGFNAPSLSSPLSPMIQSARPGIAAVPRSGTARVSAAGPGVAARASGTAAKTRRAGIDAIERRENHRNERNLPRAKRRMDFEYYEQIRDGDIPVDFDGAIPRQVFDDFLPLVENAPANFNDSYINDPRFRSVMTMTSGTLFDRNRGVSPGGRKIMEAVRETDPVLYSHMVRVGLMAGFLALKMGMSLEFSERVMWTATLHDIGKTDPKILAVINKKGKLDEDERKIMMEHTVRGAEMLLTVPGLPPALRSDAVDVAQTHHEKLDGSGYPYGLSGEQISLQARITAVADFFDALMENRPYRGGLALEEALAIIKKDSRGLDPKVLKVLTDLIERSIQDNRAAQN